METPEFRRRWSLVASEGRNVSTSYGALTDEQSEVSPAFHGRAEGTVALVVAARAGSAGVAFQTSGLFRPLDGTRATGSAFVLLAFACSFPVHVCSLQSSFIALNGFFSELHVICHLAIVFQ